MATKTQQDKPGLSFEFFPPRTDKGRDTLRTVIDELAPLNPAYFSCTFGAGGSTQQGTYETVSQIAQLGHPVAPHITCIGSTKDTIKTLLQSYIDIGINRIVALRGDLPQDGRSVGEFSYADELVAFIRKCTGDHFQIEVAVYPEKHPESDNLQQDLINFKLKADAGANAAITQYFFNADAYFRFVDDCHKLDITIPIVPGIMPITNYKQLAGFSERCGAEIPRWIHTRLAGLGGDLDSIREFGFEVVGNLCAQLLKGGAPGLHFYTLNRSEPSRQLWKSLNQSG